MMLPDWRSQLKRRPAAMITSAWPIPKIRPRFPMSMTEIGMIVRKLAPAVVHEHEGDARLFNELIERAGAAAEAHAAAAEEQGLLRVVDDLRRRLQIRVIGMDRVFPRGARRHGGLGLLDLDIQDIGRQLKEDRARAFPPRRAGRRSTGTRGSVWCHSRWPPTW